MKKILNIVFVICLIWVLIAPISEASNKQVKQNNVALEAGVSEIIFSEIDTDRWQYGYATENIFIKKSAKLNAEVISEINFNDEILFYQYNKEWACVFVNNTIGYARSFYITTTKCPNIEYEFPCNNGFKSYMSYTTITDKLSKQYELQLLADISTYGIRQINGRCCVAIGTAFNTDIGTYFDLILENGEIIPCIVSDIKSDIHTKSDNITTAKNGCVVEFIVDVEYLDESVKKSGDISMCSESWESPASKIKIYSKNILKGEDYGIKENKN